MEKIGLIVKVKMKKLANHEGTPLIVSDRFYTVFEERVAELLKDACRRAYENGRKTVLPKDI